MIKQLKAFTVNLVAGANVATIAVMLLAGYADHINPASHPALACIGMAFPLFLLLNMAFLFFWTVFKWRKMWIPVVGYLLAYVPINIYMPLNKTQEQPEDGRLIKLVSYNVCQYGGNYKYDDGFGAVMGYLTEQKADIVCVQEDVDTWRRYAFKEYQKLYPYNDTLHFSHQPTSVNGVGIHTVYPILRRERISYDSRANGSVAYYLLVGSDTVLVVNNHLESMHLSQDDRTQYKTMLRGKMGRDSVKAESRLLIEKLADATQQRAHQADAVHRYIEAHRQYPTIVCGDFNDNPISYARRTIGEGLTDCFRETGCGIGLSYNQKGFWVRIDHIFCSEDFQPYNCYVDGKIDYSDHNPVVCWLKMRDKH